MLPSDICRTCATQNNNLLPLASCSEKLQELTQIPLLELIGDENLPQHLCGDCLAKLENAYAFVEQARKVNRDLLMKLRQCLLEETPIDIPIPNAMQQQIKMEMDDEDGDQQELDEEETAATRLELKWHADSDAESEAEEEEAADGNEDEYKPYQPRRSLRKIKQQSDSEQEYQERDEKINLNLEKNDPEPPPKRRRGRPPRLAKTLALNSDGRHVCAECGKTFSWYRDMQRHARSHFEEAAFNCPQCGKGFLRKDKYMSHLKSHEKRQAKRENVELSKEWIFAERLYNSEQLRLIECKLCGVQFERLKDLRSHLELHSSKETLGQLQLDQEVVKEHFADENIDLEKVKDLITNDISEGHLEKFCAVVNSNGYELSLSDSDEDLPPDIEPKYHCVLCNVPFKRKHLLIRHTVEEHSKGHNQPQLRCNLCQIGFVCLNLYEQHQRSQCYGKFKRYGCRKCPGKFMWLENLDKHECVQSREEDKQILCCLCDAQLPSLVQLRAHLLSHRDGLTGIDPLYQATFFRCYYPKGLACSQSELSSRIVGDFDAQDYGRYYNASLSSGQELDFYDSDSDESDAPGESQEKPLHSCTLCGESMKRLTNLIEHQQNCHQDETESFSYSCKDCSEKFVCDALLLQHRRRSCGKLHAKFHCQLCQMHFVWQTNYEQHLRVNHPSEKDLDQIIKRKPVAAPSARLQCNECDKVFIWPKDLNRHKRMHQPRTASQYECTHCERKFHRKDGLKSHMRVHSEEMQQLEKIDNDEHDEKPQASQILSELSRPHGCKRIQCMICHSQHSKIADLRCHLMSHQFVISLPPEREKDIVGVSKSLYPELSVALSRDNLISRIMNDIGKGVELERFISVTNESGFELSLDSSETDSDTDEEDAKTDRQKINRYTCSICQVEVKRKHQLYAHQLDHHPCAEAAANVCSHCQARFVSEQLLEHHLKSQCRNNHKRHQCRKCTWRFRWRENLKLHNNVCHQADDSLLGPDGGELRCKECHRTFKMQKDLTRHMLMHSDTSIYRCRWCARRFYRQANLLQHIERHGISADQLPYAESLLNSYNHPHGQKIIQCKVCNINFNSISGLRHHLKSSPNESHHELSSMQNYSITNHLGYELNLDDSETDDEEIKSGGSNEIYTCSMCHLRCARKYELYQHQQAMHRLERIPDGCDQCIFKSVSSDIIEHHKRNQCENQEKTFKCSKCGFKFMWESNMLIHMDLQHQKTEEEEQAQEQQIVEPATDSVINSSSNSKQMQQIFQCALCPRKYNRKDRLTAHMKKFHNPSGPSTTSGAGQSSTTSKKSTAAASSSTLASAAKQPKLFLCAFCGKAVSSSSNLIIHMRRHTGEKPFKCDFCEMAFPRSSDLQCHRRTHTGERPHVCTVCQKGFARSYKLQQHMRIHNGERPYKCTYCEKSFTQSNDLTLHIRRHTGERPYQCGICGERFIQGTALKNHRQQQGHHEPGAPGGLPGEAPIRRTVLQQFSGE
ncbi:uncharacterized protein Dwil_GK12937 [Drosophila willistoni]|uniref:Zinc finger protein Xfin n=1 Tax=Drosophila willistoni TaxID=7260 RepID=B4NIJ6_DROWI|nr:zinc finger protein Xfin [Drosophila willistoni]EDW84819.1 uncharacterized protein Dwil_GK12937 [Drosophila willistoni]